MEFRQLITFRAVAEHLSFTRAAEALRYAQSSVTAQIQALEEELGAPLFERLGKRVVLNPAGQRFLQYSERLLRLADEARLAVQTGDEPTGQLTIGAPESLCTYRLPPVLRQFRARFPRVQLIFRPGLCSEMRRTIGDGSFDAVFTLEPPVQQPNLLVRPLVPEPMCVITQPDHRLTRLARVGPRDLEGEPALVTEAGCSYREHFETALSAAGVRVTTTLEFGSVEAIKQCVMAGLGIATLPAMTVAAEVAQGRLAVLPWVGPEWGLVTQVAWHKDKWLSPALRAFLQVTGEVLTPGAPPLLPAPHREGERGGSGDEQTSTIELSGTQLRKRSEPV